MKAPDKRAAQQIQKALLAHAPSEIARRIYAYLHRLQDADSTWLKTVYKELKLPSPDTYNFPDQLKLKDHIRSMEVQTFYDSFILLAHRATENTHHPSPASLQNILLAARQKDSTNYALLDPNIIKLVRTLNEFPAIYTVGSCGGHETITNPSQWPVGSYYVKFDIDPTNTGWYVLEFLAWAVNNDYAQGYPAHLMPTAPPPYLNSPGNVLSFVIESTDGESPDHLADFLKRVKPNLITP